MSGSLYAEPGIINKGRHDQHNKEENMVDIYVSAESLRVYDNPWMEGMTPNTPEPAEVQHPGMWHQSLDRLQFPPSLLMFNFYVSFSVVWFLSVICGCTL